MTLPSDILTRSADEAVRRIALHLLHETRAAAARIVAGDEGGAGDELRESLRALDLHLRVLGQRFDVHAEGEGLFALARDASSDATAIAQATLAFANRSARSLRTLSIELDAESRAPSYGVALAGVIRLAAAELVAALEDFEHDGAIVRAVEVAEAAMVARDLLGPAVSCTAAAKAREACSRIATAALEESGPGLHELASSASRDALRAALDDAARALEASTESEIEHKYLLRCFPPRAADVHPKDLAQGYVPGERLHERLRRVRHGSHVKYIRTVKLGSGLARMEIEEETTEDIFHAMWPLTEGCRIHKERYAVKDGALTWTIDRFVDRDLVLAEVEVPSSEIAPSPPDWLAEYIVKDVTGDPAYVNLNLAR